VVSYSFAVSIPASGKDHGGREWSSLTTTTGLLFLLDKTSGNRCSTLLISGTRWEAEAGQRLDPRHDSSALLTCQKETDVRRAVKTRFIGEELSTFAPTQSVTRSAGLIIRKA
jgi:hypothetical protein